MTFKNMKIEDIISDESYPKKDILNSLMSRITKLTTEIKEDITEDAVTYHVRDMEFARLVPEEEYVQVIIELPYDRIVDIAHNCEVDYFNGRDGVDIVSYKVCSTVDIQYGVSIAKQSFTYRKRLKL